MAFTYPVKWISSAMRGAPQISGSAGAYIGALDAFLLNGWGAVNAISVSVSGGVGTAQLPEGLYFEDHSIVLLGGVTTPAALHGEARVLSHANNMITFETNAPDGIATTGSAISIRYAPVGNWSKPYQGTNLAAYRSMDVQSSGHYLRVDDSGTTVARLVAYETMADINTGTGPYPTAAMVSGGGSLWKSTVASSAAARYLMAADSRMMLWAIEPGSAASVNYKTANVRGFGEGIALAPGGDPWATLLSCAITSGALGSGSLSGGGVSDAGGFTACARNFSGLGSSVYLSPYPFSGTAGQYSGADNALGAAPSSVDGKIRLSRLYMRTASTDSPRIVVPGVAYVPHTGLLTQCAPWDTVPGSGEWAGRKLIAIGVGGSATSAPTGIAFVDLTGPWR